MPLIRYRTSPYWKSAIDLGPSLARLADDLPGTEENGLGRALRSLAVELPAAVAVDLISGTSTRQAVVLQLVAALELVDRIYPALDTAGARAAADALAEQLLADDFGVPAETPAATLVPAGERAPEAAPEAEPEMPAPSAGLAANELAAALNQAGAGATVSTPPVVPVVATDTPIASVAVTPGPSAS